MASKKKSKSSNKPKQEDPIGDFLRVLAKRVKDGEIRGILTIVIGSEPGQNQLQWVGQVTPGEVSLPLATAQHVFVNMALQQGKQSAQ